MRKNIGYAILISMLVFIGFLEFPSKVYGEVAQPKVTAVDFNYINNTTLSFGYSLHYSVSFDQDVYVDVSGGVPYIEIGLDNGRKARAILYTAGHTYSISDSLSFIYNPQEGDYDSNGIDKGSSIVLNGGTMTGSVSGLSIDTGLYNIENMNYYVDAIRPYVESVTFPENKVYKAGDLLRFDVRFSELLGCQGTSCLTLNLDGGRTVNASCTFGTDAYYMRRIITYSYTIQPGDMALGGISLGTGIQGGFLKGQAGFGYFPKELNRSISIALDGKDTSGLRIDTQAPSVISCGMSPAGTYKAGRNIDCTVDFDEPVFVSSEGDLPYISLLLDGGIEKKAEYAAGSGTQRLVFRYTVGIGDMDADGITAGGSIELNGRTIADSAGNPASAAASFAGTGEIFIDGSSLVQLASVPAAGTYIIGDTLNFSLKFDQAVDVETSGGTPFIDINLDDGASARAFYAGGSGSDQLDFRCTVESGMGDSSGITVNRQILLNGGNIQYVTGDLPPLLLDSLPDTSAIRIEGNPPKVESVSVPANGTYDAGKKLLFTVNFDKTVNLSLDGSLPYIELTIGSKAVNAEYKDMSGTSGLLFEYTLADDDAAPGAPVMGSYINMNGCSLKSELGNPADLTLNNIGNMTGIKLIGKIPEITSVSFSESRIYKEYEEIVITVGFNERVFYQNDYFYPENPFIELQMDGLTARAVLTEGSGTEYLIFKYRIDPYVNDTDGISAGNRIVLEAYFQSIKDSDGNDANLLLTDLPDTSGIIVDTRRPDTISADIPSAGSYKAGSVLNFTVKYSEKVQMTPSEPLPYLQFYTDSWAPVIAGYTGGLGTDSLHFSYTVREGDNFRFSWLDYFAFEYSLTDYAGHGIGTGLYSSMMPSLSGIATDTRRPKITAVSVPANGSYPADAELVFKVRYDEPVFVDDSGELPELEVITDAEENASAVYVSGEGTQELIFSYIIKAGTFDRDGISLGANILNASVISDKAGNCAIEKLNNITDSSRIFLDGISPVITAVDTVSGAAVYTEGQQLELTVKFDDTVFVSTVGGLPTLPLIISDGITGSAVYTEGSSANTLRFAYTVRNGDKNDGTIKQGGALELNGGTIKDVSGNAAMLTFDSTGILLPARIDAEAPRIVSAKRVDDTHVSVKLSEPCLDLRSTDNGGFTVEEAGTSATYDVLSTAASENGSFVVLSVMDVGRSANKGLTIKYSPLLSGRIMDNAGNRLLKDETGVAAEAWDTEGPTIISTWLDPSFRFLDIVFNERVYGSSDGTSALDLDKLNLIFESNEGVVKSVTMSSIKQKISDNESASPALTGGEKAVRVFLKMDGSPSGTETIEITPVTGTAIYDKAGNRSLDTLSTGKIKLIYLPPSSPSLPSDNNSTGFYSSITNTENGQTINSITVDNSRLAGMISGLPAGTSTISIDADDNADVIDVQLGGQALERMISGGITLDVSTDDIIYSLPAACLNMEQIQDQLGNSTTEGISVNITINEASEEMQEIIRDASEANHYEVVVRPIEFTITCTNGNASTEISRFSGYVDRLVAIPEGIDPGKVTTGVILNEDGTLTHVPTSIVVIDGRYFARIRSLTNSIYTLISNPVVFKDMEGHWARNDVDDLYSRMILSGSVNRTYLPERNITRAEFAAILVRALGLSHIEGGKQAYIDVDGSKWYYSPVSIAFEYGILQEAQNTRFRPEAFITRSEAMVMIYRAMVLTGYEANMTEEDRTQLLRAFKDGNEFLNSPEAATCIKEGIILGNSGRILGNNSLTRAQAAAVIRRMMIKTGLI